MKNNLKKQNKLLKIIILILTISIVLISIIFKKEYDSKTCVINKEEKKEEIPKVDSLDNSFYVGIYNYNENEDNVCSYTTTLVLTSDYNALFYVGDCHNKTYYYGKYRIEDKKIYLYSLKLEDSSTSEELKVDDDEIYFNLTDDTEVITSIYGRDVSIRLKKLYNVV